jgi:hypothetical protein
MECWSSVDGVIEEIMKIHRSLPVRPGIDEVEAAKGLILNVEKEDQIKFESIGKQSKGNDVPDELFMILQEMQKNFVYFQSNEQKREAFKLLDLENVHSLFDELIQRASDCVSNGGSSGGAGSTGSDFMQLVILMVLLQLFRRIFRRIRLLVLVLVVVLISRFLQLLLLQVWFMWIKKFLLKLLNCSQEMIVM